MLLIYYPFRSAGFSADRSVAVQQSRCNTAQHTGKSALLSGSQLLIASAPDSNSSPAIPFLINSIFVVAGLVELFINSVSPVANSPGEEALLQRAIQSVTGDTRASQSLFGDFKKQHMSTEKSVITVLGIFKMHVHKSVTVGELQEVCSRSMLSQRLGGIIQEQKWPARIQML